MLAVKGCTVLKEQVATLGRGRLNNHAAFHFHMQSMAEPLTVVPVDPGTVSHKGDRCGLLWRDLHSYPVVHDGKAVGQVLDCVTVGDIDGDLVTLFNGKVSHAKGWGHGKHIDPYFVAIANDR